MNVQLTCACGRRHEVAVSLAGQMTPCASCGRPLVVPALGIAVANNRRAIPSTPADPRPFADVRRATPAPATEQRASSGRAIGTVLVAGGLLLLVLTGLGLWKLGLLERLPRVNLAGPAAPAEPSVDPEPQPFALVPADAPPAPAAPPAAPQATSEPPISKPLDPEPPAAVKPLPPVMNVNKPPPAQKPAVPIALPKLPFAVGDTFLQDLVVTQKSRFLVQGIPVATLLQYRVVSRYTVGKVQPDGALAVQQKIESAVLLQADELTKGLIAAPVAQLPGTAFSLEVSPRGEVIKLAGAGDAVAVGPAKLPGGLGVQMASLMDVDGWKELGQATFYQPEDRTKAGRWVRPITHQWGPLGSWAGQVMYAFPGPDHAAQVKVPYTLKLAYQAPKGLGIPGALPFQVGASEFQPPTAAGTLLFDTQVGRSVAADERFHVRGALVLILLGQKTPTEIEEEQLFQMRIVAK
jgi:hypothetical protein